MRRFVPLIGLLAVIAAAGCESGGEGSGDCALTVTFDGAVYEGHTVQVAPSQGKPVGTGVWPACNDSDGETEQDEEIELVELEGVSPELALVWPGFGDAVFVRRGRDFPPEVEALLRAVRCRSADEPLDLFGPWLGILGADGHTELDLQPPYDLDVLVERASAARYERAFLTVRVPVSLGKPLTRADIKSSLWRAGTVALRVRCGGKGEYVAEAVSAQPGA